MLPIFSICSSKNMSATQSKQLGREYMYYAQNIDTVKFISQSYLVYLNKNL